MRKQRTLLALVVVVVALFAFTATASALVGININPGGNVVKTTVAGQPMRFIDSTGITITCDVTLNETWVNKLTKVAGQQVATWTGGTAANCAGGNGIISVDGVILHLGMNSPKQFVSFQGVLPNITSLLLRINPLRILIRYKDNLVPPNTIGCLFQGPVGFNTGGPAANQIDRLIIQQNQIVPLILQLFGGAIWPCPGNIRVAGTFLMNPIQNLILRNQ